MVIVIVVVVVVVVGVVVVSRDQARVAQATHATSTDPQGPSRSHSVQHVQHLVVEVEQDVPKKMIYLSKLLSTLIFFLLIFIDYRTFEHSTPVLMLDDLCPHLN